MGLIIDTGVLIRLERDPAAVDFSTYKRAYGEGLSAGRSNFSWSASANGDGGARRSVVERSSMFQPPPLTLKFSAVTRLVSALGRGATRRADLIIDYSDHRLSGADYHG
jgi:hypothetical protein